MRECYSDGMTIEVVNWDKYNPRKDLKATSWFRMQNTMFEDPDFFDFSDAEFKAMLYLFCQCSKKQTGIIRVNLAHVDRIGRIKERDFWSAISKLESLQAVRITEGVCDVDVTQTLRARHTTNERTNERNAATSVADAPEIATLKSSLPEEFQKAMRPGVAEAWLEAYEDLAWLEHQFKLAKAWCAANPKRAPKSDYARFLNDWLARGWEKHRKGIPVRGGDVRSGVVNTKPLKLEDIA